MQHKCIEDATYSQALIKVLEKGKRLTHIIRPTLEPCLANSLDLSVVSLGLSFGAAGTLKALFVDSVVLVSDEVFLSGSLVSFRVDVRISDSEAKRFISVMRAD